MKYLGLDQEQVAQTILTALGSSVGYASTIWIDPATGIDFFMGVQYETNEIESLDEIRNIPLSLQGKDGPITIPVSGDSGLMLAGDGTTVSVPDALERLES